MKTALTRCNPVDEVVIPSFGDGSGIRAEEQQAVVEALASLQGQQEEEEDEGSDVPGGDNVVQQFELLLRAIAVVAMGDATHRGEIEGVLADLEGVALQRGCTAHMGRGA